MLSAMRAVSRMHHFALAFDAKCQRMITLKAQTMSSAWGVWAARVEWCLSEIMSCGLNCKAQNLNLIPPVLFLDLDSSPFLIQ